jgi:cytochrome c oxidase subunit 2
MNEALHSALHAAGPQAAHWVDLWRIFLFMCTGVFALVLLAVVRVLWRRPRAEAVTPPDLSAVNRAEPTLRRSVAASLFASVLLLFALLVASVFTDRALARLSLADAVNIEVTGHQWWWSVRYLDGGPSDTFITANEIHVPVGRPVIVQLKADDVIHSLWVPSLSGKKDLIPGRSATMQFRADKPGVYRGQCAEYCGFQHAFMALYVIADEPAAYDAWVQGQRAPVPEPKDAKAIRGKEIFQSTSCAMCHAIGGTLAGAQKGPNLTHVASRRTLASGTLENTPENLRQWIAAPQHVKPGTNMPPATFTGEDIDALVAYLGGLR